MIIDANSYWFDEHIFHDETLCEQFLAEVPRAYDTEGCHAAIAARGAEAIIPTRKNGQEWNGGSAGAKARNEILRTTHRLGRTIWKKWSHYHRRSLVETKMRCFKLLGERVMARDFDRQVAELQVRAAVLNRFTRLGTPVTVRVA